SINDVRSDAALRRLSVPEWVGLLDESRDDRPDGSIYFWSGYADGWGSDAGSSAARSHGASSRIRRRHWIFGAGPLTLCGGAGVDPLRMVGGVRSSGRRSVVRRGCAGDALEDRLQFVSIAGGILSSGPNPS